MQPADAWDAMVLVGRIARPHGLRGHVVVNPETDFPETRFAPGSQLWTRQAGVPGVLTVATFRMQGTRPVVLFEGFERIEDVEALGGCELRVPETSLQVLAPGQFYEHQLVGCRVETVGGGTVGTVTRLDGGMAGSVLVVGGERGEVLIPFATAICLTIDIPSRRIVIDPPEGLLELNEVRGTSRERTR